ncbi:MAG: hypothetical protein D6741_00920 [Planctomycetota bacterium]|nr:MAG: hypothetical protein D6741_00920 [Planctomycetota bacterium]
MFTNRLLALRVHHELARIQRNEYRQLLSDLLASCRDVDPLVPPETAPAACGRRESTTSDIVADLLSD